MTRDAGLSAGPPYDARSVANLVLDRVAELGSDVTQMQLYKIVYFAHGWYLATRRQKLVSQSFEAWSYGPVVRVLRDAFKDFGKEPITSKAERFDLFTGELLPIESLQDRKDIEFINQIVDFYHVYDGWKLSDLTHETGSPWDQVWNAKNPVGNLGLRLDDEAIRSYFVQLPKRFPAH
jgi:uncharacterized phage-associated protein